MGFIEPTGEHVLLGYVPPLPVREAEAVRDLAMTDIRDYARKVNVSKSYEKTAHRFVFYDDSKGQVGSGLTDTFMAVSIAKKERRFQSMRISFLELILKHNRRYSNYREVYAFDWFKDRVFAHKTTTEILGSMALIENPLTHKNEGVLFQERFESVLPLEPDDCDELCGRMLTIAYSVKNTQAA